MKYRNLHLPDGIWKYKVGSQNVDIRGPDGERFIIKCAEIAGISDWERAKWKKYDQVKPSQIRDWILSKV